MSCRRVRMVGVTIAVTAAVSALFYTAAVTAQQGDNPTPPVKGLYNDREITFIHTEASDPKVAALLSRMMGPKVVLVPSLARVPPALLADVYVFTNGIIDGGPMGFQLDVFDSVPGDARYTPLRALNLVTWRRDVVPRLLGSAANVKAAAAKGRITIARPGIVINMPILAWPGGGR